MKASKHFQVSLLACIAVVGVLMSSSAAGLASIQPRPTSPPERPAAVAHPVYHAPVSRVTHVNPPVHSIARPGPHGMNYHPGTTHVGKQIPRRAPVDVHHAVVAPRRLVFVNPHHYRAWAWHHGVAWYPDHHYWGGFFWGPIAIGFVAAPSVIVPVAVDSPGHQVLASYDLTETPCDDLAPQVDLYGPDGSLVCAMPNNEVPAGRYNIDQSTLSLAQTDEE